MGQRAKTIKPLEENIGRDLQDMGFSNNFLDIPPKSIINKRRNRKLGFMKTTILCIEG